MFHVVGCFYWIFYQLSLPKCKGVSNDVAVTVMKKLRGSPYWKGALNRELTGMFNFFYS